MPRRLLHGTLVIALVGALAACGSQPAEDEVPEVAAPPATETPTPTPSPTVEAAEPTRECVEYDQVGGPYEGAEAAIVDAAAQVEVPHDVALIPGFQFVGSVDEPGMLEAVVRICSEPLTRGELIEVGNAIAKAIYATPESESLALLMVSPYLPGGEFLEQDPNLDVVSTDYQLYLWEDGFPLEGNWD